VGDLPTGDAFYIADWIDGEDVARILARGPLPSRTVLAVVSAIAPALIILHSLGHLHRDLKPHNILVPRRAAGLAYDQAMLLDFGNQQSLWASTNRGLRSRAGRISGTLRYMAPEQFLGQPQTVATDVYGLGATMFAMLFARSIRALNGILEGQAADGTGPRVFVGPGVMQCLTMEIELPSEPEIDSGVRRLVKRMLRIDSSERPASIAEVLVEVERLMSQGDATDGTKACCTVAEKQ
jgi:serine/threonine protein kinase